MHKLPHCLAAGQYLPVLESAACSRSVGIMWPTLANKFHRGLLQSAARSVEQTIPAGIHICLAAECVYVDICQRCFTLNWLTRMDCTMTKKLRCHTQVVRTHANFKNLNRHN